MEPYKDVAPEKLRAEREAVSWQQEYNNNYATFLNNAGWTVDRLLTSAELRREYLAGTPLPELPDTLAFIATATR